MPSRMISSVTSKVVVNGEEDFDTTSDSSKEVDGKAQPEDGTKEDQAKGSHPQGSKDSDTTQGCVCI